MIKDSGNSPEHQEGIRCKAPRERRLRRIPHTLQGGATDGNAAGDALMVIQGGRVIETLQFITQEMKEFEEEYAGKGFQEYKDNRKLQKLMDRTVENILTALIEVSGTMLIQEGIAAASYSEVLREAAKACGLSKNEQDDLSALALHRNRLAHRYLNFRWEAVSAYAQQRKTIRSLLSSILEREKKNSVR